MTTTTDLAVHRIEVRPAADEPDPLGEAACRDAAEILPGVSAVHSARVFLIEGQLTPGRVQAITDELLADPVSQTATVGVSDAAGPVVEVHYLPGVMDPVAQSTRDAILEMLPDLDAEHLQVRTGFRYDVDSRGDLTDVQLHQFAERFLANSVIQAIHEQPYQPDRFVDTQPYTLNVTHVPIRELNSDELKKLSRDGHLFLSLDEMLAIQQYYRDAEREPTDIELETLAQTWSEHCVHKTLKSRIRYKSDDGGQGSAIHFAGRPGHTVHDDGSVTIDNLLRSTIAAATKQLMSEELEGWCVSVFEDNAGIVKFDNEDGVCIKVETHNHPSAIEPYGGAATGIGGCIRDILGTGLAAKPIANTDVFCVANPGIKPEDLPKGVLHPKRVLRRVVDGVRDYGNRMGIPTVNGAVWFHDNYLGNPLVFAGCIGIIPLDKCFGNARPGDRIIALGGRTGRDGIHGATFSSAELTDTHADEFSHAVQIGNAITQKKVMDVILQARDHQRGCLFHAITDCGAGGFSSAVGEMGEKVGAAVTLETAPLKYDGLSYVEIWISEAQERMVMAVAPENLQALRELCESEDVEMCDLGEFGLHDDKSEPQLALTYKGTEVGRLSMHLLHDGIPTPVREATWKSDAETKSQSDEVRSSSGSNTTSSLSHSVSSSLLGLLSHPNIASKHWIVKQYDHEVQGASVVKPLVGPQQDGPSDAAVLRPKLSSDRGIAIASGLATGLGEGTASTQGDAYHMVLAAIDECVRNAVCVGADPKRIAILDNFCWPSCDDPQQLGSVVRAAEACYDGALAYRTPFVSGKDSLNNQFTTDDGKVITIPPTMLITGLGIVDDVARCVTMDAKAVGNVLLIVGTTTAALGGSHLQMIDAKSCVANDELSVVDLEAGPRNARAVASLIAEGLVAAAHDCSDGGLLVAAAEMAFAGRVGLDLDVAALPTTGDVDDNAKCFAETPSRYLLEVAPENTGDVQSKLQEAGAPFAVIGAFAEHNRLTLGNAVDESLDELRDLWLKPLDW